MTTIAFIGLAAPVAVRLAGNTDRLEEFRRVVQRGRALRITYYTATRDETTDRVVDPMRMLMVGGKGYLEAWCRRAEGVRLFRLDRVEDVTVLDEPAAPPPDEDWITLGFLDEQARPREVRLMWSATPIAAPTAWPTIKPVEERPNAWPRVSGPTAPTSR